MIYAFSNSCVTDFVVLYRSAKRVYLMLKFNPNTKEITKGQWLKHTDIRHNNCSLNDNGTFTYVTANYSTVPNRHNENCCGYRCTSTPPFFTSNSQGDFTWFKDRWDPVSHNHNNIIELNPEDKAYIEAYCAKQTISSVPPNSQLKPAPYIKLRINKEDN